MKKELSTVTEIQWMVDEFYELVKKDEILAPFFSKVNWEKHLPTMYKFWENTLFYTGSYSGNPILSHQKLHQKNPLHEELFSRWLALFIQNLETHFEGEKMELAKQRATSISTVMMIKILPFPGQ